MLIQHTVYVAKLNNNNVTVLNIYSDGDLIKNIIFDNNQYRYIIRRPEDLFILKYLIRHNICTTDNKNYSILHKRHIKLHTIFMLTLTANILLQVL